MISRAVWALVALVGCGGNARPARDRVLDKIPAGVTAIIAADARALSHPRFRAVVDVLRTEVPAGLDCVVDAALAAEHVAAGVGPSGEVTIALATRAHVRCSALSRIDDDLWIATLGTGAPAAGASVLTGEEHARARPYLRDAPVALFATRNNLRVLATATPEPLAAWAAFDASDIPAATAFASELRSIVGAAAANEAIAPLSKAITIERTGSQVVARLGNVPGDLAVPLRAALDRSRAVTVARTFACPASLTPPVMRCEQRDAEHNQLEVYSLASALDDLIAARKEPVIVNGRIEGVRLRDDLTTYGLAIGDLVVAIDGKRLTSAEQLAPALQNVRERTSLLISRAHRFGTIELVEH